MFFRSGMQDLLEQRMDSLVNLEETLQRMQSSGSISASMPMDYGELVEVLCSGYPLHFEQDVAALDETAPQSYGTLAIVVVYVLIPTICKIWQGHPLAHRFVPGSADIPEAPFLVLLSAVSSFLMLRALFSCLRLATQDLVNTYEAFVILHRTASAHHQMHTELERKAALPSRGGTQIFNKFGEARRTHLLDDDMVQTLTATSEPPEFLEPPEWRKQVRFKSSLMRGADFHISLSHKHRFDSIMRRVYGVDSREHCRSFVELDLRKSDQLRKWWAMRSFIEAGLLRHKVFAELLLLFALAALAFLIGFSVLWFHLIGHAVASHFMTAWESLFLGIATFRLLKSCARLNSILESDSKRLSSIYNDVVDEVSHDSKNRAQQLSPLFTTPGSPEWHARRSSSSLPHDPLRPVQPQMWAERSAGHRATLQLLKVYIDSLDRDHRPLQLFGITINQPLLSRGYLVAFSAVSTAAVHATARLLLRMDSVDKSL